MAEDTKKPVNVDDFIAAVDHPTRRADAQTLNAMFQRITGCSPACSGPRS